MKASASVGAMPAFCGSSPVLSWTNNSGRRFCELISLANASQTLGRSTEWTASNRATASLALLDCSGPIRCRARSGQTEVNPGHFALASCTRFSPKTRCPASITGRIASAENVLDTAIKVTDARSRRACLQARAISSSTLASPSEGCVLVCEGSWGDMFKCERQLRRSIQLYRVRVRLFEPFPLPLPFGVGDQNVTRQIQSQQTKAEEACRNSRQACVAGADSRRAIDARTRPFTRGCARQADSPGGRRTFQPRPAQCSRPAGSRFFSRDGVEIGGVY